jgi:tetraacyldisaccharide 4'-kinase
LRLGPLPAFLLPLTLPLSWAYRGVIAARNAKFDRGIGVHRLDRPVISVGNITTGGTGKTPMVAWIARLLIEHGCTPVIAMRGYKSQPGAMSDEEAEYRDLLPDVSVLANPDRIAALHEFLPTHPEVKCIILDDGFQHRQIHRDLDLVLIDASAETFRDRLLPAGNLREPLVNLKRADAVIVTHAPSIVRGLRSEIAHFMTHKLDATDRDNLRAFDRKVSDLASGMSNIQGEVDELESQLKRYAGFPPLALSRHRWTRLDMQSSEGQTTSLKLSWLHGKRIATMLGIGRPQSVQEELVQQGAKLAGNIAAADHQHYDDAKVAVARNLCKESDALMVTAKDWVKLRSLIDLKTWPVPIVVPRLEIDVVVGEVALRERVLAAVVESMAGQPTR